MVLIIFPKNCVEGMNKYGKIKKVGKRKWTHEIIVVPLLTYGYIYSLHTP